MVDIADYIETLPGSEVNLFQNNEIYITKYDKKLNE